MVWNFVIQIVGSLALMTISYALSPKPKLKPPRAAGLDDFDLPTPEEGRPIPVVFGTVLLRGPNGAGPVISAGWSRASRRRGTQLWALRQRKPEQF